MNCIDKMGISVAIADSHRLFIAGCRSALDQTTDLEVVGEAHDLPSALELVAAEQPGILLLDIGMVSDDVKARVALLKQRSEATRVLAVASCCSQVRANELLSAGCHGLVDKGADASEVRAAVRALSRGRQFISLEGKVTLLDAGDPTTHGPAPAPTTGEGLSAREESVLSFIARGLTNQQIASELFLSVKTIETYRSRIQKKLGVRGRSELYDVAHKRGLLPHAEGLPTPGGAETPAC